MFSIENLPDLSSSKPLAVKADERASNSFAFQEADPVALEETPTPNFCIRDYVYSSRSKGIETSWPFAHRSLKFCLKHDIKDILPPFEPPSLVRSNCVGRIAGTDRPIACSVVEETTRNILLEQTDIDPCKGNRYGLDSCNLLEEQVVNCLDSDSRFTLNDWNSTEIEDTEPSFKPQSFNKLLEKKCRTVAKLGAISDSGRADDLVSNSSTISDIMASKICPVCKTFSSTSNTTLNAHIDQCLSTESSAKMVMSKFSQNKVKPRKKRSMVDIYATARHCTLEDLNRRNGTNWVIELKLLVAPNNEVRNDNRDDSKRPKLLAIEDLPPKESSVEAKDKETDEPVYVDSNGIKLRILSKFNNESLQSDEFKPRKHERGSMVCKNILVVKRKHSATKYLRNLKMKTRKGNLYSFNLLKSQIQTKPPGDFVVENDQKSKKSKSPISDDEHNQVNNGRISVLSRWVCSKRSDMLQKITDNDARFTITNMSNASASLLARESLLDLSNSSLKQRRHKKLSRSSSGLLKTKKVDFICNSVYTVADEKRKSVKSSMPLGGESSSSPNSLLLKLSRSSRNLMSSSKGKLESNNDTLYMSDSTFDMSKRPLRSSISSSMKHLSSVDLNKNESNTLQYSDSDQRQIKESERPKKFRKYRSKLRSARKRAAVNASLECGVLGFTKDIDLDFFEEAKALGSSEFAQLKAKCLETTKEQKRHHGSKSLEKMIDAMNITAELSSKNDSAECSDQWAAYNNIVYGAATVKNIEKSHYSEQVAFLCRDVNTICRNSSEAHTEQYKQTPDYAIGNVDTQMLDEIEIRGTKDCGIEEIEECHADRTSLQESDCCLTNHGDLEIQIPHKTFSVTSIRAMSNGNKTVSSDRELSASLISTASVVSLPSPKGTESKNSNAKLMTKLINAQYKLPFTDSFEESNGTTEIVDIERRNHHQVRENLLEVEPKQALDDNFCYSCRESISNASQSSRQDPTIMRSKGQQVPSLLLVPRISSSFSAYQNKTVNTTNLELPLQAGSMMNSHDTAMKYPICADLGSPSPSSQSNTLSTSSPVLRLMGKNLMVMHNEELIQPQISPSEYSRVKNLSPEFASTSNILSQESISYHQHQHNHHPYHHFNLHDHQQQIFSGSPASSAGTTKIDSHQESLGLQVPLQLMDGFVRSPFHNYQVTQTDWYPNQKRPSKTNAPYTVNKVIVIDDSPDKGSTLKGFLVNSMGSLPHTAPDLAPPPPVPYYLLPSQRPEVNDSQRAFFHNFYPGSHARFVNQSSYAASQPQILPNQFIFQSSSAGQVRPTMYFSNTLG